MGVDLPRSRLGQQQVSVVCSGHISSPAEGGKHQPVPAVYVMFHSVWACLSLDLALLLRPKGHFSVFKGAGLLVAYYRYHSGETVFQSSCFAEIECNLFLWMKLLSVLQAFNVQRGIYQATLQECFLWEAWLILHTPKSYICSFSPLTNSVLVPKMHRHIKPNHVQSGFYLHVFFKVTHTPN